MFTPALTPCSAQPFGLQVVYIMLRVAISTSKVQLAAAPAVLNVITSNDSQCRQFKLSCPKLISHLVCAQHRRCSA